MIELNYWFFVLLANFLILIIVLRVILFKPLLNISSERQKIINNSLNQAKELNEKKESTLNEINIELGKTKSRAGDIYNRLKQDGQDTQKEHLAKAYAESNKMIKKATEEIASEKEKAKESLRKEVVNYTDEIVKKLINIL